ncbi:MAG: hypothetical protein SFZ03_04640 [Candidatus Melainabacteria bacterium]|nr:hypothetical protein [Candidatus Melainabacteria bacterium]
MSSEIASNHPVRPVVIPGNNGGPDLTAYIDPTSANELRSLAQTGQFTQAPGDGLEGSIDLGLRASFG